MKHLRKSTLILGSNLIIVTSINKLEDSDVVSDISDETFCVCLQNALVGFKFEPQLFQDCFGYDTLASPTLQDFWGRIKKIPFEIQHHRISNQIFTNRFFPDTKFVHYHREVLSSENNSHVTCGVWEFGINQKIGFVCGPCGPCGSCDLSVTKNLEQELDRFLQTLFGMCQLTACFVVTHLDVRPYLDYEVVVDVHESMHKLCVSVASTKKATFARL